jgi:hypothetical protein
MIEDIILDARNNRVAYAIVWFGGFRGVTGISQSPESPEF